MRDHQYLFTLVALVCLFDFIRAGRIIEVKPADTVLKKGTLSGTTLLRCSLADIEAFETLEWKKGTTTICNAAKAVSLAATAPECETDHKTKYGMDNTTNQQYDLQTKAVVDFSYGDDYTCASSNKKEGFEEPTDPEVYTAKLTVVGETSCPEPTINANKDVEIKLNCTVEYSGKKPVLTIKPTTGDALETTVTISDTDPTKTAEGTATQKFEEAGEFNYTCTTTFKGPAYEDEAPCLMTVTVKGPDTTADPDNAAVGLQSHIYFSLLVGAVTFWLTRMV